MKIIATVWLLIASFAEAVPLTLAAGQSRTLEWNAIRRVSAADGKVIRVRSLSRSEILIVGLKPGQTTLRMWNEKSEERAFEVTVLSPSLASTLSPGNPVIKVSLEFLELDSSVGEVLGVRWPEAIQFGASGALGGGADLTGLNYTIAFSTAKGMLQGLVKEGWAKLLAKPDLYVRVGEEALFHSGGEIPVSTSSENYGRYHRHVEWKPFGLSVRVRPQSADYYHINSDIKVEVSELNPAVTLEGIPGLTRRNVETKTSSVDGETVILSGLIRQIEAHEKHAVPGLGRLPVLGHFFSQSGKRSEDNEIILAVTFSVASAVQDRTALESVRKRWRSGG